MAMELKRLQGNRCPGHPWSSLREEQRECRDNGAEGAEILFQLANGSKTSTGLMAMIETAMASDGIEATPASHTSHEEFMSRLRRHLWKPREANAKRIR